MSKATGKGGKRHTCSDKEAVAAYRRVLKLVNGYIGKNLNPDMLVTWSGGLMTWREIRLHISEAIALRHPLLRKKRRAAVRP